MKEVASGKTEKFTFSFKLSDERLKLFLDIGPNPPPEEKKQDNQEKKEKEPQPVPPQPVPTQAGQKKEVKKAEPKPEPVPVSKDEILAVFPKDVWDAAIHHEVLDHIAKELSLGAEIKERRVAKGTAPEDGENERFIITVKKMSPKAELQEDERGYVDFKDLHRFENVRSGTIVAKLYPPKQGKPGTDPLGQPIAAKNGASAKFSFDDTLALKPHTEGDGQDLIAAVDGYLSDDNGKLSISQELKVSGSIDYKVGSIDFIGSVEIQGDVLPGFVVRGRKGVIVKGSVQEGTVISSEGSVEIRGHCNGSISNKIEAKNQIILKVANQVEAQSGINITILKEARDCQLRTGGIISGVKAALIGGEMFAGCGVEAKEIGARGGSSTTISLSSDIGMTKEFAENKMQIAEHEKILSLLRAHLGPLAKTESGLAGLSPKHQEKLLPMFQKKRSVEASLHNLKLKQEEFLGKAKTNHQFRVNYIDKLHSGVTVIVGEEIYQVKETLKGPKSLNYDPEKKAFEITDLSGLECSIVEMPEENKDGRKRSK